MVEQNAAATEHVIGFAVLLHDPVPVLLGNSIGAIGMKWSILILRNFLNFSIKL